MTARAYLAFVSRHPRLALFGFVTAAGSSFGQTFFIGVFGPSIQGEFALSHTAWGGIYLLGTLGSAALLPWTGKFIDRLPATRYAAVVWSAGAAACAYFALAWSPAALVLGILLLRQAGQGLMSHLAVTTMARSFEAERGRAIAVATLGFSAGQALLPFAAVLANQSWGWRGSYVAAAAALALGLWPVTRLLLGPLTAALRREEAPSASAGPRLEPWTRREVLRDARFYLLVPGLIAPSIVVTALFFHHLHVADAKGWSHTWMTGSYAVYALAATLTSLVAGALVDRLSAVRILPPMLLPQALSTVVIGLAAEPWTLWVYLTLLAVTNGVSHTAVSAMWAELYGVRHVGAIRSLGASLSVLGSALGPVLMGGLLDAGASLLSISLGFSAYSLLGALGMRLALRVRPDPRT